MQHFYCCGGAEALYLAEERRRARMARQAAQADLKRLKAARKLGLKSIGPLT